jgi:glycosyltransferase involved in cell wall biosynthesis
MGVHQIVATAAPADPATQAALLLRPLLRRLGPSEIYAARVDPALEGEVVPLARFGPRAGPGHAPVLVYHAGAGHADVLSFLLEGSEDIVLVSQNVPRPESLAALEPRLAQRLALGRAELSRLKGRVRLALADTALTAAELEDLGYGEVQVCPLPVDLDLLRDTEPHPATLVHLQEYVEGPLILYAGPLLPHERLDLLVEAYHALVTYLLPDARLAVVGPAPVPAYHDVVQGLVQRLELIGAWVAPDVLVEELVCFYRTATVFATVSEHPGFSAAAVHALGFDVPVVARSAGGLPETLGGAGLLLPADTGPLLMAESLAAVLEDGDLHHALVATGRDRLPALDARAGEAAYLGHLAAVL